jgi:hypothetical protein
MPGLGTAVKLTSPAATKIYAEARLNPNSTVLDALLQTLSGTMNRRAINAAANLLGFRLIRPRRRWNQPRTTF